MKISSTKFLLAFGITTASITLVCLHIISGDQLVSILQIIIPAFFASNVIASHASFQIPQRSEQNVLNDELSKEDLIDNLKHGNE